MYFSLMSLSYKPEPKIWVKQPAYLTVIILLVTESALVPLVAWGWPVFTGNWALAVRYRDGFQEITSWCYLTTGVCCFRCLSFIHSHLFIHALTQQVFCGLPIVCRAPILRDLGGSYQGASPDQQHPHPYPSDNTQVTPGDDSAPGRSLESQCRDFIRCSFILQTHTQTHAHTRTPSIPWLHLPLHPS